MTKFLLDTNTLSAAARLDPKVLRKVEQHEGEMAVSSISLHELEWGYLQLDEGKMKTMVEQFLDTVRRELRILSYDEAAAGWHANHRNGKKILLDEMIAACAVTQGLILVTRNVKDFQRFKIDLEVW